MPKYYHFWKMSSFKLMYVHHVYPYPQSIRLNAWKKVGLDHYKLSSCIEILELKSPEVLTFWQSGLNLIFNSFSSKNTAVSSFIKVSIVSYVLLLQYSNKNVTFHPFSGILVDQNWQKVMLVLTCLENQSNFFQLYLHHFPLNEWLDSFLVEAGGLFL